jgi:hypothetical protein
MTTGTPPGRWDRLAADLSAAGIAATVDAQPYAHAVYGRICHCVRVAVSRAARSRHSRCRRRSRSCMPRRGCHSCLCGPDLQEQHDYLELKARSSSFPAGPGTLERDTAPAKLADPQTHVTVKPGEKNTWTASKKFNAAPKMLCVLRGID